MTGGHFVFHMHIKALTRKERLGGENRDYSDIDI
jgi:hypothetical protein